MNVDLNESSSNNELYICPIVQNEIDFAFMAENCDKTFVEQQFNEGKYCFNQDLFKDSVVAPTYATKEHAYGLKITDK